MTTTRPLEMIHIDLFDPITYISIGGNKYGLVIIDDYSCFSWAQNEFDAKVKKIMSDNGSEFKNTPIEDYLDQECIKNEFWHPILHNRIGWSRERIGLSLSRQA
jgi:hypothetical protein